MDGRQTFIDNNTCPDIYADGIVHVENLGSVCRVFFYSYTAEFPGGPLERMIVAKLIRPLTSLHTGVISQLLARAPNAQLLLGRH